MIHLTEAERGKLIAHSTAQTPRPFPTGLKLALYSSSTGLDTGTPAAEITSPATRQAISFVSGANSNEINFPQLAVSTPSFFGIYDSLGNLIFWGDVSNAIEIDGTGRVKFAVGSIAIALDNGVTCGLTAYARNKALLHFTGETSWSAPTSLEINIHTTTTGLDAGTASHPVAVDYTGVAISFSGVANLPVEFAAATSAWGAFAAFSIDDQLGNIIWRFQQSGFVNLSSVLLCQAGSITLGVSP